MPSYSTLNPSRNNLPIWVIVFANLEPSSRSTSLARCAQVCKHWSQLALPLLWRYLDEITPLLKLLGPMSYTPPPLNKGPLWVSILKPGCVICLLLRHIQAIHYRQAYSVALA